MKDGKRIGLCLSGGGYRAAAYHIGTLRKLREMGILNKVDVISSNSGGSITAATFALNKNDWEKFESIMMAGLKRNLITRILFSLQTLLAISMLIGIAILLHYTAGSGWSVIAIILLIGLFQYSLFPFSLRNSKSYSKIFVGGSKLSDLPNSPALVINSTNVETGRLFTFSKNGMNDTKYLWPDDGGGKIEFLGNDFPISRAIAASTCVPFAFSPVRINSRYFKQKSDTRRANPRLIDGGVYDNQGIHKVAFEKSSFSCELIIVSDAGNEMPFRHKYRNVLSLLIRVSDVFMNRIKNLQMMDLLFKNVHVKNREVAYHSLAWDPQKSIGEFIRSLKEDQVLTEVWRFHGVTKSEIAMEQWDLIEKKLEHSVGYEEILKCSNSEQQELLARSVPTNLVPLKNKKIEALINHAYLMTELQIKLYCPSLISAS